MAIASVPPAAAEELLPQTITARPIKAVVELFTSQGCSSCPPADQLMQTYAESKDVMALSLPVDYWDYLGWKDTLASSKNTERQRAYARSFGQGPVYTPQMVVNGVSHAVGSNREEIDSAIEQDRKSFAARRIPVKFTLHESMFLVELGAAPDGVQPKPATIWLGVVQKSVSVPIKRGENTGTTVTYHNVVRDLVPVGAWDGKPKQLQLTSASMLRAGSEATILLVQEGEVGPIIAAAWLGQ
ncbi:MAG: DUF1223 domain-containing protein [Hyphomicrobium sp.]